MALLEHNQAIITARDAIAARSALVAIASVNGRAAHPFVEYPAAPLNDADRDAFLALMDDESEPNKALHSGAEWFKSLGL